MSKILFLLYRQNDIDKIIEVNYQNYVIDKLTCEIMVMVSTNLIKYTLILKMTTTIPRLFKADNSPIIN